MVIQSREQVPLDALIPALSDRRLERHRVGWIDGSIRQAVKYQDRHP
jgi:hypothetical protein